MTTVSQLSRQFLYNTIKELLTNADLNVITSKIVRTQLQQKLNLNDLNERKAEINDIIKEVLTSMNDANDKCKRGESAANETKTCVERSDSNIEQKHKIEGQKQENNNNECQTNSIKENNESESDSDDLNISESESDEEVARRLHEREVDSRLRNNRKTVRKSEKKRKKKTEDDNNDEQKEKKKRRTGYMKPCTLSPAMADFMGQNELPRCEVVKRIWDYCKEKNLLDPKNKQFAICDNELSKIFGKRKRIKLFGMMKHLSKHLQ